MSYTCQAGASATYFKLCLYVNLGNQSSSANPRRMIKYSNSTYLNYLLYADAARTQIVGPPGGGYAAYTWSLAVPAGQSTQNATLYARVPAGQSVSAGSFQETNAEGVLRYAWSTSGTPADCAASGTKDVSIGHSGTTANGTYFSDLLTEMPVSS